MQEQSLNMVEKAAEVAQESGLISRENGVKILAGIGAGTVLYAGFKLGKFIVKKVKSASADTVKKERKSAEEETVKTEIKEETTEEVA